MTTQAWIVRDADGETITGYWEQSWAEEYVEEHPGEGLTIQEIEI